MPPNLCHQLVDRGAGVIPRDFRMQPPPFAFDRIEVWRVWRQEVQLHLRQVCQRQPRLTTAVDAVVVDDQVDSPRTGMPPHQIDEQSVALVSVGQARPPLSDRASGGFV